MKKFFILFVIVCLATPLFAQRRGGARTPGISQRQAHQHQRIKQGVKSGELTREETKELHHGQREVRQMKREAKADGTVTKEERRRIHQKQNQESREIYRMKHNEEKK
ncbi:MAG: hypothetical protein AB1633_07660 [Elusimicrobiota bacterium]